MSYVRDALDDAVNERISEILLKLQNDPVQTPSYAELAAAIAAFAQKLEGHGALPDEFDALLALYRSYSCDENRACYIQGARDFRDIITGKREIFSEKEG